MSAHFTPLANVASWRDLYLQALFETDTETVWARIAEAEKALVSREHELFAAAPGSMAERDAINTALHSLRVLRHCLPPPPDTLAD